MLKRLACQCSVGTPETAVALSGLQSVSLCPPPIPATPTTPGIISYTICSYVPPADAPLSPVWDDPELSPKIRRACAFARANGYQYIWIDSCCIDKTSSSEHSEAINSMFKWYSWAEVCFAFLADVRAEEDPEEEDSTFQRSRWFTRGWTLQELIAPAHVEFLAMNWTSIGSKTSLGTLVSKITNINYTALLRLEPLNEFSVAQRLSWASRRMTTRVEDRAYSLLGFFDIQMPTLYGEGKRAFRRLQEEIMRVIPDQSLFAWSWNYPDSLRLHAERGPSSRLRCSPYQYRSEHVAADASLLAPSLDLFSLCGEIEAVPHDEVARRLQLEGKPNIPASSYDFTPHGIRTQLPTISLALYLYLLGKVPGDSHLSGWYLVVLGCEHSDLPGHLLGRVCHIPAASESTIPFLYSGLANITVPADPPVHPLRTYSLDLLPLSLTANSAQTPFLHWKIDFKTIHIPHSDRRIDEPRVVAFRKTHERMCLVLTKKTRHALCTQGYMPSLQGTDRTAPNTQCLTLLPLDKSHSIKIEFQHTLDKDGAELSLDAYVRIAARGARGLRDDHLWDLTGTVSWRDSYPWAPVLEKRFVVTKIGPRTLEIVLELHLVAPEHYVPHIEVCHEWILATPPSYWQLPRTAAGSQSDLVDNSSQQNVDSGENEGSDEFEQAEGGHAETGKGGKEEEGGPTESDGLREGAPSWWGVSCDF